MTSERHDVPPAPRHLTREEVLARGRPFLPLPEDQRIEMTEEEWTAFWAAINE